MFRPAAAKAKGKAAAKGGARPKGAARPAPVHPRRVRHRPAARAPDPGERDIEEDIVEKFESGGEVGSDKLPVHVLGPGVKIIVDKAVYGGEVLSVAGVVAKVEVEGLNSEVLIKPSGTLSEGLLKYITGNPGGLLRIHLCRPECDQLRSNPDLLHCRQLRKALAAHAADWEDNLAVVDELPQLREEHEKWLQPDKEKEGEESSSSRKRKKKKSKKKKDKKKSGERKKIGGRSVAQKALPVIYAGTGMDPDPHVRKKLLRKVKKRLKKSTKDSGTSDSSGTSSSTEEDDLEAEVLQDRSKIQRMAQLGPGILSAESIKAMKRYVMMGAGQPCEVDQQALPPIACQYARQYVMPKASPAIGREVVTLSHIIDMLALGRIAEGLDVATQRLKSLELTLQGQPWQTSQKVEVVGSIDAQLASRAEVEVAQRESRLDQRSKGGGSQGSNWEKGKGKTKAPGKEKDKGGKGERNKGGGKQDNKKGS